MTVTSILPRAGYEPVPATAAPSAEVPEAGIKPVPPLAATPDASPGPNDQSTSRHLADLKIYGPLSAMQVYQADQANPPPDLPELGWLMLASRFYGPLPRR